MSDEPTFVPDDTEEQNTPEGEVHEPEPDLPDEDDPEFQAEVAAGEEEEGDDDA